MRQQVPAPLAAYAEALAAAAGTAASGWHHTAGHNVAAALDAAVCTPELPYHDRHHAAETTLAMGWLCAAARAERQLSGHEAALGVIAMLGHDLAHDGSPPLGGILERRAAQRVAAATAHLALSDRDAAIIRTIILHTDPALVPLTAARVAGDMAPGPHGPSVDLLCGLANEADILPSILPTLGWTLAEHLAAEWRNTGYAARAASVVGFRGRLSFLRLYPRFTRAATIMGVARLHAIQMAAFTSLDFGPEDGGPLTDAEAAARALDAMPAAAAHRRYADALAFAAG